MQIKIISFNPEIFLSDFFVGESNSSLSIVYHGKEKYYPINTSLANLSEKKKIKALISDDLTELISIFLSMRGVNNLNILEILRLLRLSKFLNISFLPESFNKYDRYLPILELPSEIINLAETGMIFPEIALSLKELRNQRDFIEILKSFRLTFSEQKEVLSFFKDNKETIEMGKITKKEELLKLIRNKQSPEYFNLLERFNKAKKQLSLPKNIRLKETPYFETKDLKIEITFKTISELKDRIGKLKENIDEKEKLWQEITKLI
ncbi:MAG: hypothetical protein N2999_07720 [Proteobacteria bacterium]|nr:hypothetical protein [Pseudomonadota bacterium]